MYSSSYTSPNKIIDSQCAEKGNLFLGTIIDIQMAINIRHPYSIWNSYRLVLFQQWLMIQIQLYQIEIIQLQKLKTFQNIRFVFISMNVFNLQKKIYKIQMYWYIVFKVPLDQQQQYNQYKKLFQFDNLGNILECKIYNQPAKEFNQNRIIYRQKIDQSKPQVNNRIYQCFLYKQLDKIISRTIAAYIMKTQKIKAKEALQNLKAIRKIVCPNSGFITQLENFEKSIIEFVNTN